MTRWVGHHPGVREALELYRLTMHEERMARLRSIHEYALTIVDEHLADRATLADALAVLKALPLTVEPSSPAPTARDLLGADLTRAEAVAGCEEVPTYDDPTALLDALSGELDRRRKDLALRRVADSAGVTV